MLSLGLYTNRELPDLYNAEPEMESDSNQESYRLNYLQEVLQQQQTINQQLTENYHEMDDQFSESLQGLQQLINNSSQKNTKEITYVIARLAEQEQLIQKFIDLCAKHNTDNEFILKRLDELEKRNEQITDILEKESLINQAILDQVSVQHASTEALTGEFKQFEAFSQSLSEQLDKQEATFDEMKKQLEVQEVFHSTVMERLDEQEAMVQKIMRQLDNLRSVVYERASYISEKFEAGFKQIVKPVQSFFVRHEDKKKAN